MEEVFFIALENKHYFLIRAAKVWCSSCDITIFFGWTRTNYTTWRGCSETKSVCCFIDTCKTFIRTTNSTIICFGTIRCYPRFRIAAYGIWIATTNCMWWAWFNRLTNWTFITYKTQKLIKCMNFVYSE